MKVDKHRSWGTSISKEEYGQILSCRVALVGDMDVEKNSQINMQVVRTITGGDESSQGRLSRTIIASANVLCHYDNLSVYTRNDRTRRFVVIPTLKDRVGETDREFIPEDLTSKSLLVSCSLYTRLMCTNKPPLTREALLFTLFQGRAYEIEDLVTYDDNSTFIECYTATRLICRRFFIGYRSMQECLRDVGYGCCVTMSKVYAIAGLTPTEGGTVIKETERDAREHKRNESMRKMFSAANRERSNEIAMLVSK
jgi:hypothetical protein